MHESAETSMVVLAAAAASTERIHFGVGVMVLALRVGHLPTDAGVFSDGIAQL